MVVDSLQIPLKTRFWILGLGPNLNVKMLINIFNAQVILDASRVRQNRALINNFQICQICFLNGWNLQFNYRV